MWTVKELKTKGKAAFKANYWKSVLVSFLLTLVSFGVNYSFRNSNAPQDVESFSNMTPEQVQAAMAITAAAAGTAFVIFLIRALVQVFLTNPLSVGALSFFRRNVENPPAELDMLMSGFTDYMHNVGVLLLRDVYLILWSLLFFIPGIIKGYSYRMVPYLAAEHPDWSAKETITRSREMMNGHKWHAFGLDMSFIGWHLLSILTLGILGIFWVVPYVGNTGAALYTTLRDQNRYQQPLY